MLHAGDIVTISAAALLMACGGMTIRSDYDPASVPGIQSYGSYRWLPHPSSGDPRVNNPLMARRIQRAVDTEMSGKGYQPVRDGRADFLVGYHVAFDEKLEVETVNAHYGYRWGGVQESYVREYTQGTLIIDVIDAKTEQLVWRGMAQAEVHEASSPDQRQKRINEAVKKILANFPPGS